LGAAAAAAHQLLRAPLHLPGRQGLVWMALLVVGRRHSRMPWAGTTVGLGAGACSLGSFVDPATGMIYSLTGIVLDWAYNELPLLRRSLFALALAGGLLHALKPLLRYGLALGAQLPHQSLAAGLAYPLTTHLVFGFLGAMGGALLARGLAIGGPRD
jgi:hypothetical protein